MNRIKLAVIAGGALFAAPVFADDTTEPAAGGTVEAGAGAEVSAGGAGAGMEATAAASGGASMAWPQAVIDRPYVLPASKIAAGGDLVIAKVSFTDPVSGMTTTSTGEGLGIIAGYGVTDKITAGLTYAFSLNEFEIKGPLTLYGEFQLAHSAKMSVAASASFTYDLAAETMGLAAGLGLRYNVAPKIAVFTGAPFGPGPVGQHLSIDLDPTNISFDVYGGAGFQATPQIFAYLSTNLAHIKISGDMNANAFFGADFIPLSLGGVFALNKNLDIHAGFNLVDLKEIGFDVFALSAGVTWYN
jgi:hypothetical protein